MKSKSYKIILKISDIFTIKAFIRKTGIKIINKAKINLKLNFKRAHKRGNKGKTYTLS